jgi:hypothetical protein
VHSHRSSATQKSKTLGPGQLGLRDPSGTKYEDKTKDQALTKYRADLGRIDRNLTKKVDKLYEKEHWTAKDWRAFRRLGAVRAAIREYERLDASSTVYRIVDDVNLPALRHGQTYVGRIDRAQGNKPSNLVVKIALNQDYTLSQMIKTLGHELYHAHQFEQGKEGLAAPGTTKGEPDPGTWDSLDEQAAFRRTQKVFGVPKENITHEWVTTTKYKDLAERPERITDASKRPGTRQTHRQFSEARIKKAAAHGRPIPAGTVLFSNFGKVYHKEYMKTQSP